MALFFLQNARIQNYVSRIISVQLSRKLQTTITVESARFNFINRIQLKNLYIQDLNGDTLLYAKKLSGTLSNINRFKKEIKISRIALDSAYINFITDSSGTLNLRFIIDRFTKKDRNADSSKTSILFKKIDIRNSVFHLGREVKRNKRNGIDFSDMYLAGLNFSLVDFSIKKGLTSFQIKDLGFREKSGFVVEKLNTSMSISRNLMYFDFISVQTPFSDIHSEWLHFDFNRFRDFSDFINKVDLNANFRSSRLGFSDISYFAPSLIGYDESINLTGKISGQISNLDGKEINISYSDSTSMEGSFTLIGLPEIKSTFINLDIANLSSTPGNLKKLKIPGKKGIRRMNIPEVITHLGKVNYSGKFTGYLDDFVAYGDFMTELGEMSTDMLLMPDTSNNLDFEGRLKVRDFSLGKFIASEDKLGKISVSANINGYTSGGSFEAVMDGLIDSLELFGYNYRNIRMEGTLTEKHFDGSLKIADPNIEMEFEGKADFAAEKPLYDFTANVTRARPYFLNLYKSDPSFFTSFLLKTNFTGKTIDDIDGEIRLVNSLFQEKEQQVQVYDIILRSGKSENKKNITIRSDILDADISGNIRFSSLVKQLKDFISSYTPSLVPNTGKSFLPDELNNFDFDVRFKNIHPIISLFLKDIDVSNKTHVTGSFDLKDKTSELTIISPLLSFYGNDWEDLVFRSQSDQVTMNVSSSSRLLTLKNNLDLENFKISSEIRNDSSGLILNWYSPQKPRNEGQLNLSLLFSQNSETRNPVIIFIFNPSDLIINDISWDIARSIIIKDSTSIRVDSFIISHLDQQVFIDGKLSEFSDDGLNFDFREMDLSVVNIFSRNGKLKAKGRLSGSAMLKDPFNKPVFLCNLVQDSLNINGEEFGKGEILASWNDDDKKIHIKATAGTGQVPAILAEGDYYPKSSAIGFKIGLDKFRLNPVQPFADTLISDLKGMATGELTFEGTLKKPELNGSLKLMKISMMVDYLKTRYNFTNEISVSKNNILFNNFEIFDEKGNKAVAQGRITSKYFRDFNLDIKLETTNFEFLNTTEKDNQSFYGQIFANGTVRVTGPPANLNMDIKARSEKNSVFFIPLYGSEDIQETNFIYWVSSSEEKEDTQNEQDRYRFNVRGLTMRFELEVTPAAEVQLIFDPKIGDIIKGRGTGNLVILLNTSGKFEMFGDINIEEGDYLFTLQNLINKKFKVEKGGQISWNGDPTDANIDLKAYYNLRTSVYPLLDDPMSDPNAEALKKRIPVDCVIGMTGKLMNPTISTDIALPTADQQTQIIVKNNINTQEELMKQFISLLVLNSFYSSQRGMASQGGIAGSNTIATAGVTGSELLSNQLSHWLSQISKDFNIGLNYRPGDQITTDELEVALSTQIFNDRLSISGNVDVGGNELSETRSANNVVGDFELNYKITDRFHVKGFNRANDNLLFQTSPYTQGVGVFYRENFNNLHELFHRYKEGLKNLFSGKKKKSTKPSDSNGINQ